jgi:tetratricopeptide (TPR) repeat protein
MPTIPEAMALALQHHQAGRLQAAEQIYRQVLASQPNHADALQLLGVIAHQVGKHELAIDHISRAIKLNADQPGYYNNLGEAYRALGKNGDAAACYRKALELHPNFAEAHSNLGAILNDEGKTEEALGCFRRTLALQPTNFQAHANLGRALEASGDFQGAEDSYRAALRHNTRFISAHYKLAKLLGGKLPDQDLAALRRLLKAGEIPDSQRLYLHFGLAHVLDARGEFYEAAKQAERGNALQRADWRKRGQEYDPREQESFITHMIGACTPEFFERVRGFRLNAEHPVFVFGLPRSGTTLIEQILASHSQVHGAGEMQLAPGLWAELGGPGGDCFEGLRRMDEATACRIAARGLEKLQSFKPAAQRIVDKTPDHYLYLGFLASLFPRAKFIHCRRDLRDVAVSCWITHFQEIPWTNDTEHIVSRFHGYQRMMEHWRRVLPVPLLEVDYEETVADLEGVSHKLVDWCGLPWEPACLEFHQAKRSVRTASAIQVRQPVYKKSVERWKNYQIALGSLFASL